MFSAQLLKVNAHIINKRIDVLRDILNANDPIIIKEFRIELSGPQLGILDISFNSEEYKFKVEAWELYPPFSDLRSWLEDMTDYLTHPSECIDIDCGNYHFLLSYDYLGYINQENGSEPTVMILMARSAKEEDNEEYDEITHFVIPIKIFIDTFYNTMKTYMYDNNKKFKEHWELTGCGKQFSTKNLMKHFVSNKIEEFIRG